ncbi:hypothetical protein QF043_001700 [Pseudomonas sp. W3I7]|uniref:hypothetical protein n=1 Tax=Pseudomonas sp. W3I7 TaxID=3042292 RepID=UPI00278CD507|nr:hypothetical protein [Pseudomonas sp. W3I7]MDQ0702908.1 hypothetical protein [Pseudomonas sp. W3I7]
MKVKIEQKKISTFRFFLARLLVWGSAILTLSGVIGIIGILDNLALWAKFGRYLVEKAQLIGFENVISGSLSLLHAVSEYWRELLYPIFDFFTYWLPFKIPPLIKDAVMIVSFVMIGRKKAFGVFSRSLDAEQVLMSQIVYKYLKDTNEKFLYFSPREAKEYLLIRKADKSILEPYEISNIAKFDRCFGEDAETFAYDVLTRPALQAYRKQHWSALRWSDRLKMLVYTLASVVVVFLLLDYIYLLQQTAGQ